MPVSKIPDLFSAQAAADPYPIYNEIREHAPLVWCEQMHLWMATRYHDVAPLLRATAFSSCTRPRRHHLSPATQEKIKELDESLSEWVVFMDGQDHRRLRQWLNKAFTPAAIAALSPRIDEAIARLLKKVEGHDVFDLVKDVAYPLPATVIAMILGIPGEDLDLVQKWSNDLSAFFAGGRPNDDRALLGQSAYSEMTAYVARISRLRREKPQDDLISAMVHAEPGGQPLTERELLANCCLLLFAGHETTTRLIGNGMLALLRHPDQVELMKGSPEMVASGVEEFLRYDPAALLVTRIVAHETEMHGVRIPASSGIALVIAAANRDPRQFPDPERFDVARDPNHHVGFGAGPHFCLGAPLARMETRQLFQALFQRYSRISLAEERLAWTGSALFRGLMSLNIGVSRA
jgi:cytochrome P450